MKEITIYEYQLKVIHDALRLTCNLHNSQEGKTSFDRQVRQAFEFANNALKGDYKATVSYTTGKTETKNK